MILAIACCVLGAASIQDSRWVRVVDAETGVGLAGVEVMEDTMSDGVFSGQYKPAVRLGVTDEEGFITHRDERGIARVELPGFTPALYPTQLGRPTRDDARVIEVLRSAHLTINVVGADGEPAEGVRVKLEGDGYFLLNRNLSGSSFPEGARLEQFTGPEGKAVFTNVPAECPLDVTLIEVTPSRVWESTRPTRALVLEAGERRVTLYGVGSSHDVVGRVIGPGGEAIPDTPIALRRAKAGWPKLHHDQTKGWRRAVTDSAGEFRFEAIPTGDWWVGVVPKSGTGPAQALALTADHAPESVSIRHWPAGRIQGRGARRTGDADGRELTEVFAYLSPVGHAGPSLNLRAAVRDPFQFEGLPPGEYELAVAKNGFGRGVARVAAGDPEVSVVLLPGARVRGRVQPARARRILAESIDLLGASWQGLGASDGIEAFDFQDLRAGTYALRAHAADGQVAFASGLEVGPGETLDDVELSLAPGALVRVHWSGSETYATVHVTVDGRTAERGKVHRGTTSAFVLPPGEVEVTLEGDGEVATQQVSLGAWQEARLRFPPRR